MRDSLPIASCIILCDGASSIAGAWSHCSFMQVPLWNLYIIVSCAERKVFWSQEEEIRRNQMKLEMISHLHASTTITGGYECWNALSNNVLHCAWELCWAPSGEGRTQSLILIAEPSAGRANQRVANRAHWSVWIIKYYWNLLNIVEYHGILNMAQNSRILNIDCGKHCL